MMKMLFSSITWSQITTKITEKKEEKQHEWGGRKFWKFNFTVPSACLWYYIKAQKKQEEEENSGHRCCFTKQQTIFPTLI